MRKPRAGFSYFFNSSLLITYIFIHLYWASLSICHSDSWKGHIIVICSLHFFKKSVLKRFRVSRIDKGQHKSFFFDVYYNSRQNKTKQSNTETLVILESRALHSVVLSSLGLIMGYWGRKLVRVQALWIPCSLNSVSKKSIQWLM